MNNKKSVLGRGLASILSDPDTDITSEESKKKDIVGNISSLNISEITRNPFQPRTDFDPEKLEELAASIQELGIIQPITVRKLGYNKYQLISGERRLRASKILEKKEIPAFIRIANDQQMLEMALIENVQRKNLNPIEIALSYKRLIEECNLTQEKCSLRVGKKRSTIANFLGLLKLPELIQSSIKEGKINMGIGKSLLNIRDKEKQINIFYDVLENKFSVREVEQLVKEFKERSYRKIRRKQSHSNNLPFSLQQSIHNLSVSLDKEIKLKNNRKGNGKLIIPFNSHEDLSQLIKKIDNKV